MSSSLVGSRYTYYVAQKASDEVHDYFEVQSGDQMGRDKWHKLGLNYQLENAEPPDAELTERVRGQFRSRGIVVY